MTRPCCSIEGCGKRHKAFGYCPAHLRRFKLYGDPLGGGPTQQRSGPSADKGQPLRWIEANKNHVGDECLIWPFALNGNGYGAVNYQGQRRNANRIMCQLAHGDPPEGTEAAHSCGNRRCCNPNHLRWASRSENMMDKLDHGTDNRGEKNPLAKLTADEVGQIRSLAGSLSQRQIAAQFGVDQSHVSDIVTGKRWGWL